MIFNLFAIIIVFLISLQQYSLGKAILFSLALFAITLALWFILEICGQVIVTLASGLFSKMFIQSKGLREEIDKRPRCIDYNLPFIALGVVVLLTWLLRVIDIPNFTQAIIFLYMSLLSVIAYIDKVFTKMDRRLFPSLLQALLYISPALYIFQHP